MMHEVVRCTRRMRIARTAASLSAEARCGAVCQLQRPAASSSCQCSASGSAGTSSVQSQIVHVPAAAPRARTWCAGVCTNQVATLGPEEGPLGDWGVCVRLEPAAASESLASTNYLAQPEGQCTIGLLYVQGA